jgi:predicted HTH transcriptional regulator
MDAAELESLLAPGEGQSVEFKKSLAQLDDGLCSLSGMVNADAAHGAILFGVSDEGMTVGVEDANLDRSQRKISTKGEKFDPRLFLDIDVGRQDDRAVIVVRATRVAPDFHDYDGRTYLREGTATRRLDVEERRQLIRRRRRDEHSPQFGQWVCDRCGALSTSVKWRLSSSGGVVSKDVDYSHECGGEFWPA